MVYSLFLMCWHVSVIGMDRKRKGQQSELKKKAVKRAPADVHMESHVAKECIQDINKSWIDGLALKTGW